MNDSPRFRRLSLLAGCAVLLTVGPGCVAWDPIVLPTLRTLLALFA